MRITWISPEGKGWALAYKLREAGNQVVYYNPSKNKNGSGYLPEVDGATYLDYAKKSVLVVVDSVPESRRTRRSWSPSDLTMDVQTLRRSGVPVLGPTPTSELVTNDLRYRTKILKRHGLESVDCQDSEQVIVTVSRDPEGQCFLVFRHRTLLGDTGPDLGNLGDIVLPVSMDQPLVARSIDKLNSFLDPVRHRGYLNMDLDVSEPELRVVNLDTGFLYPAVFVQFTNLLLASQKRAVCPGVAVTVLNLKPDQDNTGTVEDVLQYGGVFGGEIHREPEEGRPILHGQFAFAVVGIGSNGQTVESDVDRKLAKLCSNNGLGFRQGVGNNVGNHLKVLQSWGWLNRGYPGYQELP